MIIGIPKELLNEEYRIAATPATVHKFVNQGHKVLVEKNAGLKIGMTDERYLEAGAEIVDDREKLWARSEFIYKVKDPTREEFKYLRDGLIVFCYLHIAANEALLDAFLKSKAIGIAYETVEKDGKLPLLKPMSEIGGCMSVVQGANFLQLAYNGEGILLHGMPGVPPAHVVVLGSGVAGSGAVRTAVGIGARVTVIGRNLDRLAQLQDIYGSRLETLYSNEYNIAQAVKEADLLIGTVLITGGKTPKLVTEKMVKTMRKGSVIIDISIDQGGCVETVDRPTSHSDPIYIKHGVIHYAVPNIPGTVAKTATYALSNVTEEYAFKIANNGWKKAAIENPEIAKGINTCKGFITYPAVAEAFDREYTPIEKFLK